MSIILGIDPGTTTVGFAVLASDGKKRELINFGVIETKPKESIEYKILDIVNDLSGIIEEYKPNIVAIEKLFFLKNVKTGIDVAQARGAMLYLFAKSGIIFKEYTPLQVKQGICGNGAANKLQVQKALQFIFKLNSLPKPDDAADAIAIAYLASLEKNLFSIKK